MTREETIEQVASKYCQDNIPNLSQMHLTVSMVFEAGAKWADEHPVKFWHSVADGDLPTPYVRCLFISYIGVESIGYMLDNEAVIADNAFAALIDEVEYWAEIPKLPKNKK